MKKKLLSVFLDESGDDGFGKEGSPEFYIFTMVFLDQRIGIESNGESIVQLSGHYLGKIAKIVMRIFSIILLILVTAVFVVSPSSLLEPLGRFKAKEF